MARDDFSIGVNSALAKRVAHRCSNPDCRVITVGPHTDANRAVSVGVAAHITAASPGGPRYDLVLNSAQRKDASNGIWLCQTCAKLIDSDVVKYSTAVLTEWKNIAEQAAAIELQTGVPPPIDKTTIQFMVDGWCLWRKKAAYNEVSQWATGDTLYCFKMRLRNFSSLDEQLSYPRLQLRSGTDVLYEDYYAIQHEIALPRLQWTTVGVEHGIHQEQQQLFKRSDSLWFAAQLVGSPRVLAWKVVSLHDTDPRSP